ncbi:MBOAT family O-acyltransferase [Rubrimonas cliftonensis]|uniref:Probable alginate O-acetylase AlgI n=1 Tax=Rubrimonas cliftonensis TaxID=89524 RepID=A0A1H4GBE0_9RHOB|nr:MBOAT family O-acyltransferase [Rubrimonas cliftonensis]SEB06300.1 D-alanyl-lipoteichoic acid acyltransferase DltB, MBOAT superfamily [Rubrimonas cliftonensis]
MTFASPAFLTLFLPLAIIAVALGRRHGGAAGAMAAALAASLLFYALWDWRLLPLLAASILINHALGRRLAARPSRALLAIGVAANLAALVWFKYALFFGELVGLAAPGSTAAVIVPLGLSFYTFQQIGYLVDVRRGHADPGDLLRYATFVSFFPQLVAGPIVRWRDLGPQLDRLGAVRLDDPAVERGVLLTVFGLAKKTLIADPIGAMIAPAWADPGAMTAYDAWVAALGYGVQLLADFSAYGEIAVGLGLIMGVRLPVNFDAPYRATSVSDFWRRWHVTLGAFLREHVYIPLGGARHGLPRCCLALGLTMLLAGLWHGAGWAFVLWGALHGAALILERLGGAGGLRLPPRLGHALTLGFVLLAWIPFRAGDISDAMTVLSALVGGQGTAMPLPWAQALGVAASPTLWFNGTEIVVLTLLIAWAATAPSIHAVADDILRRPTRAAAGVFATMAAVSFSLGTEAPFLYWSF